MIELTSSLLLIVQKQNYNLVSGMQSVSQTPKLSESWMRFGTCNNQNRSDDKTIRSAFPILVRRPIFFVTVLLILVLVTVLAFEQLKREPAKHEVPPSAMSRFDRMRTFEKHANTIEYAPNPQFPSYGPDSISSLRRRRRSESKAAAGRARILARQLERRMGWQLSGTPGNHQ